MPTSSLNTSVALIGDEPRIVLTVARSLAAMGVPVDLIYSDSVAAKSRVFRHTLRVSPPGRDFNAYGDEVSRCIEGLAMPLAIPCSDTALRLIKARGGQLATICRVAAPGLAAIHAVLDKSETMQLARAAGVPVPSRYELPDLAAVCSARGSLVFPLIAKPNSKDGTPARFKVKYFHTFDELEREFIEDPRFGANYLIQEYVSGHGVGIGMLVSDGEAVAVSQHRRFKELPARGGVAVTAESEPVDAELAGHSLRLLRKIGWQGLAMVEFKRSETGRVCLMEVNGRFWGSIALAVASGVDFPRYVWELHNGVPHAALGQPHRRTRFCWSAGELTRLGELATTPGIGSGSLVHETAEFFTNLLVRGGHPVFRVTDPAPGILELWRVGRDAAGRRASSLLRRVLPRTLLTAIKRSRALPSKARLVYGRELARRTARISRPAPSGGVRTVLFVCHGNIMRSAFAAAYLRNRCGASVQVLSAGVRAKTGKPADRRALEVASDFGISLQEHTASRLSQESIDLADLIVVMDYTNEAMLLAEYPAARPRVAMLGAFGTKSRREGRLLTRTISRSKW